jgi:hypothetical protein
MDRQAKHQLARATVVAHLGKMGFRVQEVSRTEGYDLLVNGEARVALRIAFPSQYAHTVRVAGRRYSYDYKSWSFNFHRHGRWDRSYCDVFVCIAKARHDSDETFVIPAAAVSGPTFSLHGTGNRPYRGRYARYRDAWRLLGGHGQGRDPQTEVA